MLGYLVHRILLVEIGSAIRNEETRRVFGIGAALLVFGVDLFPYLHRLNDDFNTLAM